MLGQIDCVDAVDELQCSALELNQCDPNTEFRCRNGLCIPREMSFDNTDDCMDWSDEWYPFYEFLVGTSGKDILCDNQRLLMSCDERVCGQNWFACGDGVCEPFIWTRPQCRSKRDVHYVRNILASNGSGCWAFAICQLGFQDFFSDELTLKTCLDSSCEQDEFIFPAEKPIAHPFVSFIYKTNRSFEYPITPDFICYDPRACQMHFKPTTIKFGNRSCNLYHEIMSNHTYSAVFFWDKLIFDIRQVNTAFLKVDSSRGKTMDSQIPRTHRN